MREDSTIATKSEQEQNRQSEKQYHSSRILTHLFFSNTPFSYAFVPSLPLANRTS
jgi:hypothetical protein